VSGAPESLPVLLVATPLFGAAAVAGVGRWIARAVADATAAAVAAACCAGAAWLLLDLGPDRRVLWLGGYQPRHGSSVGIDLVADRAGVVLVLVAAVLTLAAVTYSWRYLEDVDASDHTLVLVFLAGMSGFALAGDLFNAFVWFELMSVAAFALTGLRVEEPRSVHGALTFGAMTSWGATVSLIGIALVYALTGELNLAAVGETLRDHGPSPTVDVAWAMLMTGFLVKAAVVPWHFWTADAEAVAPTPVCALLSGSMVTLGVYGVARCWWTMFDGVVATEVMREALVALGVVTALVGAVMCTAQRHIKRLLAYSTISHVGVMTIAVGLLSSEGVAAAGLYAIGHACAKGALFLGTGVLLNRFETVDEHLLHGRGRDMPLTRLTFLFGALGLAGFPACGVWLGKSVLEHAVVSEGWPWLVVVLVVVSGCTGGSVLRLTLRVFWALGPVPADADSSRHDEERETEAALRRAPLSMIGPSWLLLAAAVALSVVPMVRGAAATAGETFVDPSGYARAVLHPGLPARSVSVAPVEGWTSSAVVLGLVAGALAVAVAVVAIWGGRAPDRVRTWLRPLRVPFRVLHSVHAGHLGSYVAWAMLGMSGLGLALLR
jgi:multicomponent Na+:H+ antiporter subunit D